jgi:hypothetical protein
MAAATCAGYAALTHPAEAVAAIGWFALVSGIAAATLREKCAPVHLRGSA